MDKKFIKYVLKEIDSEKSLQDVEKHLQTSKVSFDDLLLSSLQTKGLTSSESKVRIEELKATYKETKVNSKNNPNTNLYLIIVFLAIGLVIAGIVFGVTSITKDDSNELKYNAVENVAEGAADAVGEAAGSVAYESTGNAVEEVTEEYVGREVQEGVGDALVDATDAAIEAAGEAVETTVKIPINQSSSSFYPATAKQKIREFLRAEDSQSLDKIMSFYSGNIYRYWNIEDPNLYKIRNNYLRVWEKIKYPSNGIEDITQVSDQRFKVSGNYSYWSIKDQKTKTRWATTYFTLDDNYRIISTSD